METVKTTWIILGHPLQLPLAMAIASGAPENFRFNLIVSRHKYWSGIDVEEIRPLFDSINFFEPIYHAHSLAELISTIGKLWKIKNIIRQLPIASEDTLLSLEAWNYVENLTTSVFRKNKQIFLCPEGIYPFVSLDRIQISSQSNRHVTKSGNTHNIFIEPMFGLKKKTLEYWVISKRNDHGIAYDHPVTELYDKVFVLKSLFTPTLNEDEIYYPYPILRQATKEPTGKKRVVFFLSGYTAAKNYYQKINRILNHLRQYYQSVYQLEIRLHPNVPEEYNKIDCTGWQINRESGNGEQYLMRHSGQIIGAFSHISTALILALNLGIPAYSYHRCMEFETDLVAWHDQTYAAAPSEFFMNSLDEKPRPYVPIANALEKSRDSLKKIYNTLTTI